MGKRKYLIFVIALFITNLTLGQSQELYSRFTAEALQHYKSEEYLRAAKSYERAFKEFEGKAYPNDRYNAACAYSLAGNTEKAFGHLFRLAESESKYRNLKLISTDADLNNLHADQRWIDLLNVVAANKAEYEKAYDEVLAAELDTIYENDQKYRKRTREIEEQHGSESEEMTSNKIMMQRTDSINLTRVKSILDEKGWLGANVVGARGVSAMFLVILHADLNIQLEYLPMIREAVEMGNFNVRNLALLEDKIALEEGGRQIYGTQISRDTASGVYYVSPLVEPEKVNERRSNVGLGKIEDYIKRWDIEWDVDKHRERDEILDRK